MIQRFVISTSFLLFIGCSSDLKVMTETVEIVQPIDFSQTVPDAPATKERVTNSDFVVIEN
ncbi:MAG: hypothetical protein QGF07_00075, partial [Phycisphaerales bacterium]|nr:hypothetical protein [Phycisphaerales bacterium]